MKFQAIHKNKIYVDGETILIDGNEYLITKDYKHEVEIDGEKSQWYEYALIYKGNDTKVKPVILLNEL